MGSPPDANGDVEEESGDMGTKESAVDSCNWKNPHDNETMNYRDSSKIIGDREDGSNAQAYEADSKIASLSHCSSRISSSCDANLNSGEGVTTCGKAALVTGESSPPKQGETLQQMPKEAICSSNPSISSRCDDKTPSGPQAIGLTCEPRRKQVIINPSEPHRVPTTSRLHFELEKAGNRYDVNSSQRNIAPIQIPISEPSVPFTDPGLRESGTTSPSNAQMNEDAITPSSLVAPTQSLKTTAPPRSSTSNLQATQPGAIAVSGIRANERNQHGGQSSSGSSPFINTIPDDDAFTQVIAIPVLSGEVPAVSITNPDVQAPEAEQAQRLKKRRKLRKQALAVLAVLSLTILVAIVVPVSIRISRQATTISSPSPPAQQETTSPSEPSFRPISNDFCEDAETLEIDGPSGDGQTKDATLDAVNDCGSISVVTPGVWYTVVGIGGWIKATACRDDGPNNEFDSEMTVWQGTCNNLMCIGGNQDDETVDCDSEAGFSWRAFKGVRYYILVSGTGSPDPFGIQIKSLPANDLCEGAIPLRVDAPILDGNTKRAYRDIVPGGSCDGVQVNIPGVWYIVVGTGVTLVATTCRDNPPNGDFSFLTVWRGTCGSLQCVGGDNNGNDDGCVNESTFAWNSEAGVVYYIIVTGNNFGIQIKSV